jgi:hypothetical protein
MRHKIEAQHVKENDLIEHKGVPKKVLSVKKHGTLSTLEHDDGTSQLLNHADYVTRHEDGDGDSRVQAGTVKFDGAFHTKKVAT